MTNQEKELFNAVPATEFNTYWIPCTWFIYRIQEAAKNKKLINDYALETIIRVPNSFCHCVSVVKKSKSIRTSQLSSRSSANFVPSADCSGATTGCPYPWCTRRYSQSTLKEEGELLD